MNTANYIVQKLSSSDDSAPSLFSLRGGLVAIFAVPVLMYMLFQTTNRIDQEVNLSAVIKAQPVGGLDTAVVGREQMEQTDLRQVSVVVAELEARATAAEAKSLELERRADRLAKELAEKTGDAGVANGGANVLFSQNPTLLLEQTEAILSDAIKLVTTFNHRIDQPAVLAGRADDELLQVRLDSTAQITEVDISQPDSAAESAQLAPASESDGISTTVSPLAAMEEQKLATLRIESPGSANKPIADATGTGSGRSSSAAQQALRQKLSTAVEANDLDQVSDLLSQGASANMKTFRGEPVISRAAWNGHTELVKLLLERGAKIDRADRSGRTALINASISGKHEVVDYLIQQGAKVDRAAKDGRTPLIAASWNNHPAVVRELLAQGARPNLKDRDGRTALFYAVWDRHNAIVEILIANQADPDIVDIEGRSLRELALQRGVFILASEQ